MNEVYLVEYDGGQYMDHFRSTDSAILFLEEAGKENCLAYRADFYLIRSNRNMDGMMLPEVVPVFVKKTTAKRHYLRATSGKLDYRQTLDVGTCDRNKYENYNDAELARQDALEVLAERLREQQAYVESVLTESRKKVKA